jgi:hypothetical protein
MIEHAQASKAAKPADPYPNLQYYEDGSVFNMPMGYWASKTEDETRQSLIDARNEEHVIEPHVGLIKEALAYHGMGFVQVE